MKGFPRRSGRFEKFGREGVQPKENIEQLRDLCGRLNLEGKQEQQR